MAFAGAFAAEDVAVGYLTVLGSNEGVRKYIIDSDGAWRQDGYLIKNSTTGCQSARSCVRGDNWFYVLDNLDSTGPFKIWRCDKSGGNMKLIASDSEATKEPFQMAISPDCTKLYVSCYRSDSPISVVDIATGTISVFQNAYTTADPKALSVAKNGMVYFANINHHQVYRFTPDGGYNANFSQGSAWGCYYDDDSDRLYTTTWAAMNYYDNASTLSGAQSTKSGAVTDFAGEAHAIAGFGGYVYWANWYDGYVERYNPAEDTKTKVVTGLGAKAPHLSIAALPEPEMDYVVTDAAGDIEIYSDFESAVESLRTKAAASISISGSKTTLGKELVVTNPVAAEGASRLAAGSVTSRALTPAERSAFLAAGCCEIAGANGYVVSAEKQDVAMAYVTVLGLGVKKYVIDSEGGWRADGYFITNSTKNCQSARSCVRAGDWFYVLDNQDGTGPFSIWRMDVRGKQATKIVDNLEATSSPFQMAVSPDGASLYVAANRSGSMITKVDIATGTCSSFESVVNVDSPRGICVAADGSVCVAIQGWHCAYRFTADGAYSAHFSQGDCWGVYYDDFRDRQYVTTWAAMNYFDNASTLLNYQSTKTGAVTGFAGEAHAIAGFGGYVYWCNWYSAYIERYDPDADSRTTVAGSIGGKASHLFIAALPEPEYRPGGFIFSIR